MAIVLKVPMSKADVPVEPASVPPAPQPEAPRKPNQWEHGSAIRTSRRGKLA
jgi:hypothetical protein